jgi:hypothetical protein
MQFAVRLWPSSIALLYFEIGGLFIRRQLMVSVCLLAAAAYAAFARADDVSAGARWFNIPSEPLAKALQTYGEIADVQVLYESALAKGQRSTAVQGNLLPKDALRILLSATDLNVFYTRPDAITLAHAAKDDKTTPDQTLANAELSLDTLRVHATQDTGDEARLRGYSEALRADIQAALSKNARTRFGTYRVGLKLWIDGSKKIQKTEVVQSTGDRSRDEAIASSLNGLVISQNAPMNTPQPVRISIAVRAVLQ